MTSLTKNYKEFTFRSKFKKSVALVIVRCFAWRNILSWRPEGIHYSHTFLVSIFRTLRTVHIVFRPELATSTVYFFRSPVYIWFFANPIVPFGSLSAFAPQSTCHPDITVVNPCRWRRRWVWRTSSSSA